MIELVPLLAVMPLGVAFLITGIAHVRGVRRLVAPLRRATAAPTLTRSSTAL